MGSCWSPAPLRRAWAWFRVDVSGSAKKGRIDMKIKKQLQLALCAAGLGLMQIAVAYDEVTAERLLKPEPENWLMYRGTYNGQGYSPLAKINPSNVKRLVP